MFSLKKPACCICECVFSLLLRCADRVAGCLLAEEHVSICVCFPGRCPFSSHMQHVVKSKLEGECDECDAMYISVFDRKSLYKSADRPCLRLEDSSAPWIRQVYCLSLQLDDGLCLITDFLCPVVMQHTAGLAGQIRKTQQVQGKPSAAAMTGWPK